MRILHLTSHLELGGIPVYVASLARMLRRRGHEVIVAADHGPLEDELARAGIAYWPVPLHTSQELSLPVWRAWRILRARLRKEPVDLIHAHTRVAQFVAGALATERACPYVITWHGIYRPNLGRMLWPCLGERVIAISEPVAQHMSETFQAPPARVRVVMNGVDIPRFGTAPPAQEVAAFRTQCGLGADAPVIGAMGRLASGGVKGFDLFLDAMVRIHAQRPDARGIIIGDGPRRAFLESEIQRLGLRGVVMMAGAIADVRVPLAAMTIFVFPARWPEGFGLTLIEAMAAGKPVVATRVGAVPTIVEHGRSGWLVEPDHPEELAEAVLALLREPARAQAYAKRGQQRVAETFSLERMTEQIESVYREVAQPSHTHG